MTGKSKLWGGRFKKETSSLMDDFNSSISFDQRLAEQDIKGSMAHAEMLGRCGIIPAQDSKKIIEGLEGILEDVRRGEIEFSKDAEDIHMNVEKILIERIGDVGRRLHTGRSRNDQVALDIRIYLKEEIDEIIALIRALQKVLADTAEENIDVVIPGYTHLQRAQPILFAHHLMAYFFMLERDIGRLSDCRRRMDALPLGAGALAGTTFPIDRDFVAEKLGFSRITENSLDSVADRDFAIEFLAAASIIMMHLSRFSEEIVLWSTSEFGFIELDDSYSTGSSIMPQKKNPDAAELVRGKTGRVYGSLMALLTVMKGIPLAYNKDMQEDKEQIFDAVDTVKACLTIFAPMIGTMKVRADRMREAAKGGFSTATDVADYLVKKGLPFRDAHGIAGRIVLDCIESGIGLEDLSIEKWKSYSELFDDDIASIIRIEASIDARDVPGGTAKKRVKEEIGIARRLLGGA